MKANEYVPPRASKVSKQGQITIPSAIRRAYDITPGSRILYYPKEDGIELRVLPPLEKEVGQPAREPLDEALRETIREIKADLDKG